MPENHACTGLATIDGTGHDIQITETEPERKGPESMDPDEVGFRPPPKPNVPDTTVPETRNVETTNGGVPEFQTTQPRKDSTSDKEWRDLQPHRSRFALLSLVRYASVALIFGSAFLFFRRAWSLYQYRELGPALSELPQWWLVQDSFGNLVLMVIGLIVLWQTSK